MADERRARVTAEEEARWVASFVKDSSERRQEYEPIWIETLQNYLVRPWQESSGVQQVQYPYLTRHDLSSSTTGQAIMKDPESHQAVEHSVSTQLGLLFPPQQPFAQSTPVGYEDAVKSRTVNGLTHYWFRKEGHFRTFNEWLKDGWIFGSGIMEGWWEYRLEPTWATLVGELGGVEIPDEVMMELPVYDDPMLRPVDLFDFFPDFSACRIIDMLCCSKRFTITKRDLDRFKGNPRYNQEAIARAIQNKTREDSQEKQDKGWREGLDRPMRTKPADEFEPMVGYVQYGVVPYKHSDGYRRRRIEVLCGETIRSEPFAGRLPFFEYSPRPIQGRFYGYSPLEAMRFHQDFIDGLLMLTSDGMARSTHPPPVVDRNADVDLARLRRFKTLVPILANRPDAIQFLQYAPPLAAAFNLILALKQQIREGSGTPGVAQGFGLENSRASATEFAGTLRQSLGRPEADAMLTEREYLPPIAQWGLAQYKRFLQSSEELQLRVGQLPQPAVLADIHEDYDIEFIGSRHEGNRVQKLASYRELFQMGGNPYAAAYVPWDKVVARFMKELGLHEEAQQVGTQVFENTLINMLQASNAMSGNRGALPRGQPLGLAPAQTAGTTAGG